MPPEPVLTGGQGRRQSVHLGGGESRHKPSLESPVTYNYEILTHTGRIQKLAKTFKVYRLSVLTIVCSGLGLVGGILSRPFAQNWTERQFMYIEFPGELYLRLLKLIIIPLLVSNVILSFGIIKGKLSSHLVKTACFLYGLCTVVAVIVAILLVLIISPGKKIPLYPKGTTNPDAYYHPHQQAYVHEFHKFDELKPADSSAALFVGHPHGHHQEPTTTSANQRQPETRRTKAAARADHPKAINSTLSEQTSLNFSLINLEHHQTLVTKLPIDVLLDVLRNLVPESFLGATVQQSRTRLIPPKEVIISANGSTHPSPADWPVAHEMINQANVIGLLAISVLVGVTLSCMDEAGKPLLDLCACLAELTLRIGTMTISLSPICIMFLLIGQTARVRDLALMAGFLFKYSLTVLLALILHGFIILPLAYYALTRKSVVHLFCGMSEPLVASLATASSSATMASMLKCLTRAGLNPVIVGGFGPLGSVMNMNGTAIYEAVGAIFIAQTLNIDLPGSSLLLVGLCSAVASLSTYGIQSSGLVSMVIVLNAINVPVSQLSLLYIVDFIIDRFRTVVNVWSGAMVCAMLDHMCPKELLEEEMKRDKYRQVVRLHESSSPANNSSGAASWTEPRVISVTITPPLENSRI